MPRYHLHRACSRGISLFAIVSGCAVATVGAAESAAKSAPTYVPRKGLSLSLWAREPMVADPVALNFDDQGRLYVAETARRGTVDIDIRSHQDWLVEDLSNRSIDDLRRFFRSRMSPERSAENAKWLPDHNKDGSHDWRDLIEIKERIRLLADPRNTGKATDSSVFYEGFHEEVTGVLAGVLPWEGDVFATVYPDLWRLRDPQSTGKADTVTSLFRGFGVHAAFDGHDIHGLVMGPDGRLYFSHGDNGFVVKTQEGRILNFPNTGGVLRMNPDGSELEVFASGLRNVQEIAFDEFGNMFGVDNDGDLADERERFVYITEGSDSGWRLHWQFKERGWKKQTRIPDYNPWINERMWIPLHAGQPAHITPPISNYSVGPSGFKYNPGTGLNDSLRNSFFLVQFPVQKITTFKTRPKGAGFEMVDEEVLLSGMMASATTFGPDGAMYIADWDGMWNPDGKGAIWKLDDPSVANTAMRREVQELLATGMKQRSVESLAELLAHADMRIRMRAQFELVRRQETSLLKTLAAKTSAPRFSRIHALWGLGQMRDSRLGDILPLSDADAEIRAQAARIAGELRASPLASTLARMLDDSEPRVQFHAALALGKLGEVSAISAIVRRLELNDNRDAFLRHACITALTAMGKRSSLSAFASHPLAAVRIAVVVALRHLGSADAALFLHDSDLNVRLEAARAIHDDDGITDALPQLAGLLPDLPSDAPEALTRRAISASSRLGRSEDAERLLKFALDSKRSDAMRGEAVETLAAWDRTPDLDRVEGVVRRTTSRSKAEAGLGQSLLQSNLLALFEAAGPGLAESITRGVSENGIRVEPSLLRELFNGENQKPTTRITALRVLAASDPAGTLPLVEKAVDSPIADLRTVSLELLANASASRFAEMVAQRFSSFRIPEQQKSLAIAGRLKQPSLDRLIASQVEALHQGTLPRELALDVLQAANARRLKVPDRAGEPVSADGSKPTASKLTEALYGGDKRRGEELFRTHVGAQCVRCHDAGGEGKQAGPVLKGVGSRSTREYLLESLVDPSAKIAPGFETVTLTLKDSDVIVGRKLSEDATKITLRLLEGEVRNVLKSEIESAATSTVSSMPPMLEILSPFELRDLVAYLSEL